MMPEQQLDHLEIEEIRDLVAYLASPTQVAIRGPAAPIDEQSGRVANALEGERVKIIRKTQGDVRKKLPPPVDSRSR
jgi:hypothetical protein